MLERIGSTYYLRRRVPIRYHGVVDGRAIRLSLHTDSESIAKAKAAQVWADLIESWEARLAGDTTDANARLAAAKNLAAARGYRFLMARDVAQLPTADFMKRVTEVAAGGRPGKPDLLAAEAILGAVQAPEVRVADVAEEFFALAADRNLGKSEDQIRRWKAPRKKAIANLVEVIGNKRIAEISTDDLWKLRAWWLKRLEDGGLTPNSANKDFTYLLNMIETVAAAKEIEIGYKRKGLKVSEGKKRTRPAFSPTWIKDKLLARGALDGLNLEARCILLGMINTGYRPSEAQGLLPHHIRLDAEVPHISIEPEGRRLKSHHSERIIPLLGVSLDAFKACPDGFPRYRDNPSLSDTVNKYLRENKLLETPGHSLYSIRHSFEDRMLHAGIDERVRRDIFGHGLDRERYGQGASLSHLAGLLALIAF